MDPVAALSLVETAVTVFMKVEPIIAQGIEDFKPFAVALYEKFTGTTITDQQRADVEAKIDELHLEFQEAIPPEDQQ